MLAMPTARATHEPSLAARLGLTVGIAIALAGCSRPNPQIPDQPVLAGPWGLSPGVHKFCDHGRAIYAFGETKGGIAVVENASECAAGIKARSGETGTGSTGTAKARTEGAAQ